MKTVLQIILLFVIIGLGYALYQSVQEPILFQEKYDQRKAAVVERLKLIREAQVAYKASNDRYTGSFDTLITFVKEGNYKITKNEGSLSDSLLNAGMTEKEALKKGIIKRDTIYVSVRDSLCKNIDPDSIEYVPFTNGAKFEMGAGSITTSSKLVIPVFEAKVPNKVYLHGLDEQYRINLDDEARQLNRYPGLKVGDLEEANNNAGNWE
ncbi:MAG: hypothetical protein MJZ18_10445 [Bacteroidales bacterium]|nr:hypothetical protein [Bacteroidales bacterium]